MLIENSTWKSVLPTRVSQLLRDPHPGTVANPHAAYLLTPTRKHKALSLSIEYMTSSETNGELELIFEARSPHRSFKYIHDWTSKSGSMYRHHNLSPSRGPQLSACNALLTFGFEMANGTLELAARQRPHRKPADFCGLRVNWKLVQFAAGELLQVAPNQKVR